MKLRALFVGDIHLEAVDKILPARAGGWLSAQLNVLQQALDYCVVENIRFCIWLGDTTENPYPQQQTIVALSQLLRRYPQIEIHINLGNHDYQSTNVDSVQTLTEFASHRELQHVHVHRQSTIVRLNGLPVVFLPWPVQHPPANAPRGSVIVAHCDTVGAVYDNGHPIVRGEGLKLRRDGHLWVIGHIHRRQQVRQAHYVGTPLQLDYLENSRKYFSDVLFTRRDAVLHGQIRAVAVRLPYTLHNLVVSNFKRLRLQPAPHYYRLTLAPGVHFPAGWLEAHPQVLRHSSKLKHAASKSQSASTGKQLVGLRGYLRQQGWSRPQTRRALRIMAEVTRELRA